MQNVYQKIPRLFLFTFYAHKLSLTIEFLLLDISDKNRGFGLLINKILQKTIPRNSFMGAVQYQLLEGYFSRNQWTNDLINRL